MKEIYNYGIYRQFEYKCKIREGYKVQRNELSDDKLNILLFDYVLKSRTEDGTMPDNPIVLKNIMTNDIVDDIAKEYGVGVATISPEDHQEVIKLNNDSGNNIIYSFHTHNPLILSDGMEYNQMIRNMENYYMAFRKDLQGAINDLYSQYGYFKDEHFTMKYGTFGGAQNLLRTMGDAGIHTFAGYKILDRAYYKDSPCEIYDIISDKELICENLLEYELNSGVRMILYPDETKKRVNMHICARGKSKSLVTHVISNLENFMKSRQYL